LSVRFGRNHTQFTRLNRFIFIASAVAVDPVQTDAVDPFFTLVFKTNSGGVRPDYGNFLKQHCARIGINIDVIVQDWPTFVGELIAFRNFDICYVALTGGGADPDFSGMIQHSVQERTNGICDKVI